MMFIHAIQKLLLSYPKNLANGFKDMSDPVEWNMKILQRTTTN